MEVNVSVLLNYLVILVILGIFAFFRGSIVVVHFDHYLFFQYDVLHFHLNLYILDFNF